MVVAGARITCRQQSIQRIASRFELLHGRGKMDEQQGRTRCVTDCAKVPFQGRRCCLNIFRGRGHASNGPSLIKLPFRFFKHLRR
jgi:hypothetical protein